jgi:hypothetical protein
VSDRRNATGTRTGASAQFKRLLDVEGVEGEGTLMGLHEPSMGGYGGAAGR